jgi:SAM-dependent methyltransferase
MLRKLFFTLQYYLSHPRWDTGITPPELISFIENNPPGRALDLGCGTGTNVIELARRGWHVSGVDFASKAIAIGREKARRAGIQVDLRTADVSKPLPFEGPFNLILDIGCLHSLPGSSRAGYFDNLSRLLGKDGTYLLYGFTGTSSKLPGLSIEDLDLLSARFRLVDRKDSTDTASGRRSTWFTFKN